MSDPAHFHANLQRGSLLLNQNRPKDALPFLQDAIAANPDAPEGYAELARCYNAIPAERSKSIPAINRAIALAPNSSRYFGLKGWYLVCLMQYHAAYQAAQKGLALDPVCPVSMNALANAHTKLGQWKNAETACRRILALDPNDGPGLNLLAQALRHQGRWKETREAVARLLANMPNNAFGNANAGYAALAAGDHLRANEHFLTSLRMDPHFDLARRGLIESLRARVWIIRINRYLSRQGTIRNLSMAFIILGCIMLVGYIGDFLNMIYPKAGTVFMVVVIGAGLLYIYLSFVTYLLVNFLLLFDPVGRHALTSLEKGRACIPVVALAAVVFALLCAQLWTAAATVIGVSSLLVFSIQFPCSKTAGNVGAQIKAASKRSPLRALVPLQ